MEATVGGVQEAVIGIMQLERGGTYSIALRANFAGAAHDHAAATCSWSAPAHPGADGIITATGIADPFATTIAFVVADNGKRLLLLLDETPAGVVGHGEAFRR